MTYATNTTPHHSYIVLVTKVQQYLQYYLLPTNIVFFTMDALAIYSTM